MHWCMAEPMRVRSNQAEALDRARDVLSEAEAVVVMAADADWLGHVVGVLSEEGRAAGFVGDPEVSTDAAAVGAFVAEQHPGAAIVEVVGNTPAAGSR